MFNHDSNDIDLVFSTTTTTPFAFERKPDISNSMVTNNLISEINIRKQNISAIENEKKKYTDLLDKLNSTKE